MGYFDFLIGSYELPMAIQNLLRTPEVQRLKDIRLLNISSPTFAGLSEARRLSHSMAVVGTSNRLVARLQRRFSNSEIQHWQAALMLHDIGTPPFGHLLEYRLHNRFNWRHDAVVADIIYGRYRFENTADQIYYDNQLRLHRVLSELSLDPDTLDSYIRGKSALGQLVAGTLDLDNLDNVFRMAAFLGLGLYNRELIKLVEAMDVVDGQLVVDEEAIEIVQLWARLRRNVYQLLIFDPPTISLQAMLTCAFDRAIQTGELSELDWKLTDDEILRRLLDYPEPEVRQLIKRIAVADYYQPIAVYWFDDAVGGGGHLSSTETRFEFEEKVSQEAGIPIISYPFAERGSFSKRLSIRIACDDSISEPIVLSEKSQSFCIGLFTPYRGSVSISKKKAAQEFVFDYLKNHGISHNRPILSYSPMFNLSMRE